VVAAAGEDLVDAYLDGVPEPHRSTMLGLRARLSELLPDAEQGIAYSVPVFKVRGKGVAGLGYYKNHCTYFPMSGSITAQLADRLQGYKTAKGSIQFPADAPLPDELVVALVEARLAEIAAIGN
jgi:uncharacterized protein YdhG (YjbR/CyaY superfamily)